MATKAELLRKNEVLEDELARAHRELERLREEVLKLKAWEDYGVSGVTD